MEKSYSSQMDEFGANSEEKKSSSLKFGWGKFRPNCLQIFNGPKCFIFLLVVFTVSQGKVKCCFIVSLLSITGLPQTSPGIVAS